MARLAALTRWNLDTQGFDWLDDDGKALVALPLRFTPAVGTILVVIGLALKSPIWVGAMAFVRKAFGAGHDHELPGL